MNTINGLNITNKVLHVTNVEHYTIALIKDFGGYTALKLIGQNIISTMFEKTKDINLGFELVEKIRVEIAKQKEQAKKFVGFENVKF